MTGTAEAFRAGYVAIVGRPNAGKSTLLNALLGQKLSIVSGKPQTTRHRIAGILTGDGYQAVFLDTPGIIEPKYLLQEAMMKTVDSALRDADIVVHLVDASAEPGRGDTGPEERASARLHVPLILALNKADIARPERLRAHAGRAAAGPTPPALIVEISALRGEGLDALVRGIVSFLPPNPPYFPADSVSDRNERFFVSEIIREKIFECYREEIPYSTTVRILEFEEKEGRKDRIAAEICVERESQKGILIGVKGAALKRVGQTARKEIEEFLGRPVFLELRVKVRDRWRDDAVWLKRLGYPGTGE